MADDFVGMTRRTARGVAKLLRAEKGESVSGPNRPQATHRSQIVGEVGRVAGAGAVIVRGIPADSDWGFALLVQRVMLPDESDAWVATGETFLMPTLPMTPAIYWKHRVLPEGSIPAEAGDIQLTRSVDGVECVDLYMPLFAVTTRGDEPYRGPRPVGP